MTVALSFSRLNTFEQCAAKFDYVYLQKAVQDTGNEASDYGDRVHKVLEAYGRQAIDKTAPPPPSTHEAVATIKRWGDLVDKFVFRPGDKYFEHKMAINNALAPVDWFAKDVWIRSIADVLVVDGDMAYCADWKTGKVKSDPTQLQLFAAMVMYHFLEVNTVNTAFVWLAHDDVTTAKYERRHLGALWSALSPRFQRVQEMVDAGVMLPKPSPLCKWCPAKTICPEARLR